MRNNIHCLLIHLYNCKPVKHTFLPLPSPVVTLSPTVHLVINVLICGGPFSLTTSKFTGRLRFRAISWTSEIGDFRSALGSFSKPQAVPVRKKQHKSINHNEVQTFYMHSLHLLKKKKGIAYKSAFWELN